MIGVSGINQLIIFPYRIIQLDACILYGMIARHFRRRIYIIRIQIHIVSRRSIRQANRFQSLAFCQTAIFSLSGRDLYLRFRFIRITNGFFPIIFPIDSRRVFQLNAQFPLLNHTIVARPGNGKGVYITRDSPYSPGIDIYQFIVAICIPGQCKRTFGFNVFANTGIRTFRTAISSGGKFRRIRCRKLHRNRTGISLEDATASPIKQIVHSRACICCTVVYLPDLRILCNARLYLIRLHNDRIADVIITILIGTKEGICAFIAYRS